MSFGRIKAMLLQELYITQNSYEVINDVIIYPLWSIIIFGFLTVYLSGVSDGPVGVYVLLGTILWQAINITQYSIAVGTLWEIWSRNLTNIFITPLSNFEYLLSYTISGTIKSILVIALGSLMSYWVFHFNILDLGLINLFFHFINLTIFAFGFGIMILGLLFRFGTRIQAFSWGLITFFQPLMAVIYPVSILPKPLQTIAYLLPPTYVFEAARINVTDQTIQWQSILTAFVLNIIFVLLTVGFYNMMFEKSKKIGQFARLEG
jgi:ABC-2 type transport system permease protein